MNPVYAVLPQAPDVATSRVFVATTLGVTAPGVVLAAGVTAAGFTLEHCSADGLDRLLDADATSRACILVESPAKALARALVDGSAAQCQDLLDAWCTAGRRLLQRALSQPARCLCADIDEIQRATPAWHEALARFLGAQAVSAAAAVGVAEPRPSPLDEFVAQAVVAQQAEASTLFEQLLACCVVLDAPQRVGPSPQEAAAALRELRMAAPRAATGPRADAGAASELETLRAEVQETLDRLFTAQADLEAALTDREALRRDLDAVRAEASQVLEQLAAGQGRLEAASAQRDTLRHELEAANDRSRAQENLLREAQQALGQTQDEARTAAEAARQEADTLLEKLHEAHEQLGRYYLEARALRSLPAMLAHGDGPLLGATGVHPAGEHVEGQHRHLDLQLRDVQFGGRRRPDARVRLVEHLGRPGLALFSSPPAGTWLSAWKTSGEEGTGEYMLIVPGDATGQAMLSHFGRTDWQVIADLAGLVLRGTLECGSARWAGVARRLCRELAAMPVRLRYDQLDVEQDGQVIRVRFGNVMFGAFEWPSVTVQWVPAGRSGRLELLAGTDDTYLPLTRWPADAEAAADRWCLPVGAGASGRDKRQAWAALPEVDRTFLLALLDALPAVAGRTSAAAGSHLAAASRVLLREAHALSKSLARRRLLRRLLGSVTSR